MECLFFVRDSASVTSLVSYFYFVVLLFIQHLFSSCYVQGSCVGYINVYRERNHQVPHLGLTLLALMLKE